MSDRDPAHDAPDFPDMDAAEPRYDPLDPESDHFRPPSIPTLVGCLHCQEEYDSYLMVWRVRTDAHDKPAGFWCCPTEGCGGIGFGFDIHPVDEDYIDPDGRDMGQWVDDEPMEPHDDPDRPPDEPTQVRCERCGKFYPSDKMVWWVDDDDPFASIMSGWMCPVRDCGGMGFGDDVRPTDPDYVDPLGRHILKPGEKRPPPSVSDDDIPF